MRSVLSFFLFLLSHLIIANPLSYVVTDSDTTSTLTTRFGVPWPVMVKANPSLNASLLKSGAELQIPEKYKVKPGDTLYSLSRKWGVTSNVVMDWNDLASPKALKAGSYLFIPIAQRKDPSKSIWPIDARPSRPQGPLLIVHFPPRKGSFDSVCDGTVLYKGAYQGLGSVILIENEEKTVFAFGNFAYSAIEYGQKVKKDQPLGLLSEKEGLTFFVSRNGQPLDPFDVGKW